MREALGLSAQHRFLNPNCPLIRALEVGCQGLKGAAAPHGWVSDWFPMCLDAQMQDSDWAWANVFPSPLYPALFLEGKPQD